MPASFVECATLSVFCIPDGVSVTPNRMATTLAPNSPTLLGSVPGNRLSRARLTRSTANFEKLLVFVSMRLIKTVAFIDPLYLSTASRNCCIFASASLFIPKNFLPVCVNPLKSMPPFILGENPNNKIRLNSCKMITYAETYPMIVKLTGGTLLKSALVWAFSSFCMSAVIDLLIKYMRTPKTALITKKIQNVLHHPARKGSMLPSLVYPMYMTSRITIGRA